MKKKKGIEKKVFVRTAKNYKCSKCKGTLVRIQYALFYCDRCGRDWFYNEDIGKFKAIK